jgi:hypothetical protein
MQRGISIVNAIATDIMAGLIITPIFLLVREHMHGFCSDRN